MKTAVPPASGNSGKGLKGLGAALLVITVGIMCGFLFFSHHDAPPGEEGAPAEEFHGITSIALDTNGSIYIGGAFGVKVLAPDQTLVREWKTPQAVTALAVDGNGNVYAAYAARVEKFGPGGKSLLVWGRGGCDGDRFGLVSGIAVAPGNVFIADSGARVVYRFSTDGRPLNEIGGKEGDPEGKGLIAPSPFLDCAVSGRALYVNNLGRRRVEKYDFGGKLLASWGKSGWEDHEFPGCCNPTNIAVCPDGNIAVAEKGSPRVKIYTGDGKLVSIFGEGDFPKECKGIDLAVAGGRIYAVDKVSSCVRVFPVNKGTEENP